MRSAWWRFCSCARFSSSHSPSQRRLPASTVLHAFGFSRSHASCVRTDSSSPARPTRSPPAIRAIVAGPRGTTCAACYNCGNLGCSLPGGWQHATIRMDALAFAVAAAGCGNAEQKRAEEARRPRTGGREAARVPAGRSRRAKGLEQMAKGLEAMAGAAPPATNTQPSTPVSFRDLQTLFPDLDGWEKAKAHRRAHDRAVRVLTGRGPLHERADPRVEMKIVDSGFNQLFLAPYAMMLQSGYEKETDRGYEKSTLVAGQPGWEKWNTEGKDGELNAFVGKRFLLTVEGRQHRRRQGAARDREQGGCRQARGAEVSDAPGNCHRRALVATTVMTPASAAAGRSARRQPARDPLGRDGAQRRDRDEPAAGVGRGAARAAAGRQRDRRRRHGRRRPRRRRADDERPRRRSLRDRLRREDEAGARPQRQRTRAGARRRRPSSAGASSTTFRTAACSRSASPASSTAGTSCSRSTARSRSRGRSSRRSATRATASP